LGGSHGKRSIYEAGFRTPIIFSWPGRVAANVTRDDLVSSVDIVPTLLDYAAVSAPDWLPGHSLYSVLERGAPWVRKQVFGWTVSLRLDQPDGGRADKSFAPAAFVRGRRWRYIWRPRAKVDELYDMDSDPGESRNLAPSSPDVASRHRESIEEWMRNMREGVRVMEAELDAQGTESTNP
jgi:choline-sulfatase